MVKKVLSKGFKVLVYIFAAFGLVLTVVFFAVKFGLTKVPGMIDLNDRLFTENKTTDNITTKNPENSISSKNLCKLAIINSLYPSNSSSIIDAIKYDSGDDKIESMLFAIEKEMAKNPKISQALSDCDSYPESDNKTNLFGWMNSEDWAVFEEAVKKDSPVINQVAKETGVPSRMMVGALVGEQLRLYNSDRETFKQFFAPLKILGNEVKFSLGVTGIKEETAMKIEANLKDRTSVFYPGPEYENMLDFKTDNPTAERVERLTDKNNRYYPYLYTALFIKEIEMQWSKAGYDISNRPEILGTLWNIGFAKSKPNPSPSAGGAIIDIEGKQYTFGGLVYDYYYSGRMLKEFPF